MIAISFHSPVARPLLCLGLLALAWGCKPAPAPTAIEKPRSDKPSDQTPGNPRRVPGTGDLANFLRSQLPPAFRVVDVTNDPPVPLPNTSPGANAWLLSVRLTFAPAEDQFVPVAQATQALQTLLDELRSLADWSQAYASSPYSDLGPSFTVNAPATTAPEMLTTAHPKDRPLAPIYGKMAAEWQVDHWQFSVLAMQTPADESKPRSAFTGPTLVQGSGEARQFWGTAQAALKTAKESRAAIEHRYQEALAQATRPGSVYRGELTLRFNGSRKNPVAAEVRFMDVTLGGADVHQAQFTLKLPQVPGYDFSFRVKLADQLPLVLPAQAGQFAGQAVASRGDMTINATQATGKDDRGASTAGALLYELHDSTARSDLPLLVHNRRLEGTLCSALLKGDLLIAAAQAP